MQSDDRIQWLIAQKFQALRKEQQLTQEALAAKANVPRQLVSMFELCERFPFTPNLIRLANALGVKLSTILKEIGE